ncbi:Rv3212 family protein [Amycolatopsis sp. NBC_01480]|uniref:Rv3212 family protein n=1 Tax=Amycolatopsis sp. NBC_01480 TaxID=2903562 RepID=UPI003FA44483
MNDHGDGAEHNAPEQPGSDVAGTPADGQQDTGSPGAEELGAGRFGEEQPSGIVSAARYEAEPASHSDEPGYAGSAAHSDEAHDAEPAAYSDESDEAEPAAYSAKRHNAEPPVYGDEDVLIPARHDVAAGRGTTPPVKARKSQWNRGRDRVIAALIAVVVVVVALIVAVNSDNLHTSRAIAEPPPALPPAPAAVPGSMAQLWQALSSATPVPIGEGGNAVTADNGEVAGRDPLTGQIRWHYTRENLQLCTVDSAWGRVNAVYHKSQGCSEVTQLNPSTGHITAQRNGDAELGTQLVSDGSHVTTTGKRLLDTWRDDLVKSMEYGQVPAIVNPNKQPRTGCTYGTVAAAAEKVGVIERCPGDPHDRLTVYKATGEHEDEPPVVFSSVLAGSRARVIAMSGDLTAVLLPDQKLLVIYGADGNEKSAYPMDLPPSDLAADPAGGVEQTSRTDSGIYWFTGTKTVALSRDDLTPRWTLDGTMGPGITFAQQLVVPIKGGLAVLNEANGSTLRTVGVDRGSYGGVVRLTALGPVLLEQRGPTLAALK